MREAGVTPRMQEIVLPHAIPAVPMRLTFGAWDEWWNEIRRDRPEELTRARISLENLNWDDPFPEPVAPIAPDSIDDGGEAINV
jgi:hypothetical protein